MATALVGIGAAGIEHQGPGVGGLLGLAGNALWKQIYDLREEVLCCTDACPPGVGIALEGFWTDRTGRMRSLAREAFSG